MSKLRPMQQEDLEQVNLLLSKSFTHARRDSGLAKGRVPLCHLSFLQMYLEANPGGSFVIVQKGRIVAYCFTHLWGTLGWIGPLSVLPAKQGQGLGKKVVEAAIEQLQASRAATIGLELAAGSSRNLAFYTKLGFIPERLTVDLVKEVTQSPQKVPTEDCEITSYAESTVAQRKSILNDISELSASLELGLDYTGEIQQLHEAGYGDGLAFRRSKRVLGFALVHTETYTAEERRHFLKVNALQLAAQSGPAALRLVLGKLEAFATVEELAAIYIRVPLRYQNAYRQILAMGYQVVQNELRMTLNGYQQDDNPENVNLSKWE